MVYRKKKRVILPQILYIIFFKVYGNQKSKYRVFAESVRN